MNSDGTLKEVEFTVSGRKIPLTEIRKRELDSVAAGFPVSIFRAFGIT